MRKTISTLFVSFLMAIAVFAQSPQAFKYQTVVRDADGNLIQNQTVSFKMSILDFNTLNFQETVEYEETHSVMCNEFGLANLYVGGGTVVSGTMANIDWGLEDHNKFLVIDLDVDGGSNYLSMGYSQLASVPYALYAENTGDIDEIVNFDGDTKINMPFNDKSIRFISQDIEFMRMTNQGYLGIGTITPNEELEIHGSIRMQDGSQGAGKIMVSDGMGTASWKDPSLIGGGGWTVSGNNMYSSVSGNVGIGTSSPGAKLDVAGRIWQTGLGNSVFIGEYAGENDDLSNNRNVFIGTSAGENNTTGPYNVAIGYEPLYSNTTGFGNIAFGFNALYLNSTGDYNYAVGENALHSNTTGEYNIATGTWALVHNTEGDNNIGMGNHCLKENTTGNNNTALGEYTLSSNTTGNNNIGFGEFTLSSNTTGHSNVAIGASALNKNTTQSNNVAIGDSALYHNGVGTSSNYAIKNTAVGSKALYSNTSGRRNTANGYESLYSNTGGWYNNAYGNETLYSNETGSNNNAMGDAALYSNTNGTGNVALGTSSLKYNIDGEFNTALGYHSGLNSTGSNNVFIGKDAGYSETGSNNNAMGDAALYSNTSGTGNVALGTSSLKYNIDGEFNTALGYHSGLNSTGSNNVFLGKAAGYSESGSNKLYIENSSASSNNALIYGEFDNDILKFHADVQLTKSTADEMIIKNNNQWEHSNGVQDFGDGGDHFIMASKEGSAESAGLYGDGDILTMWSAGDNAPGQSYAYLYILDEDAFSDGDGDPYNNSAIKAYLATSGNWLSASDKNKKENIKQLSSSLDKLMNINGYSYSLKQSAEEKSKGTKQETTYGVIAQEVENVLPEVIEKNDDGEYFVSYTEFIPVLIEAVKEQQQTIEELRQNIEKLEGEVNQLKKNIE